MILFVFFGEADESLRDSLFIISADWKVTVDRLETLMTLVIPVDCLIALPSFWSPIWFSRS